MRYNASQRRNIPPIPNKITRSTYSITAKRKHLRREASQERITCSTSCVPTCLVSDKLISLVEERGTVAFIISVSIEHRRINFGSTCIDYKPVLFFSVCPLPRSGATLKITACIPAPRATSHPRTTRSHVTIPYLF